MSKKPSIPKGTRDFTPVEMNRREYIFSIIRKNFTNYGFEPLETPAMENLSTLLGKYGEEGDKLLFRVLNSGDFLSKVDRSSLDNIEAKDLSQHITEKGLRYDLTVPFARYIVQHQNETTFPFRRYQIQPVWRADRPQKGRYREFYQCDADVIGSYSLWNEIELIQLINDVFCDLNLKVDIKLNNRKVLVGFAELIGKPDLFITITTAIDKLEKIGLEAVYKELKINGMEDWQIAALVPLINLSGSSRGKLEKLEEKFENNETGKKGIKELRYIIDYVESNSLSSRVSLDFSLARGLNYYTGTIIEVKAVDVNIGSICGGGRYDDLTGIFGLPGVSGVGISFGADRIYDVLLQQEAFPAEVKNATKVLFVNFGEKEARYCMNWLNTLRKLSIPGELYPDSVKLKKQMNYANQKGIPFVALAGEEEISKNVVSLKNMETGQQNEMNLEKLKEVLL